MIWRVTDFAGVMFATIIKNSKRLPDRLPWIEPSINCLHLESVISLLVGNIECAILSTCSLLEHVLRLALVNKNECGLQRTETTEELDQYKSLTELINTAVDSDIFLGCDEAWWKAVSKNIRNKSAHYLLPTVLRNCGADQILKKYIPEQELPEKMDDWYYKQYVTDWGSFYHRAGGYLAELFLRDATEQLKIVIGNTRWTGDTSWWISQKAEYDDFFEYNWTRENVLNSFAGAIKKW